MKIEAVPVTSAEQKITVLIVDDDPSTLELIGNFLQRRGFRTRVAESGETGLEIIRNEQPHIVLLDLFLPDLSGLDILRRINREGLGTPVITISGEADHDAARESLSLGAADFVTKPLNLQYLQASLLAKLIDLGHDLAGSGLS